jgi:cell division protein FtsW
VLAPLLVPSPLFFLLLGQPDFGTVAIVSLVILLLMLIAGVPKRIWAGTVLILTLVGTALVFSTPYRRSRVLGFLDPWQDPGGKGFQILQSQMGLYNGRLFGVGLGNGKEKLFYLPEAHNDFIFAVIGEELGLVGVISVVAAFVFLVLRGMQISWRSFERFGDRFGMLLGSSITLALGLQAFINMSVVLGLLPTKGLTLPFISYGGSSLVVDLFAVGVLLSIAQGPTQVRWEIKE